jgi:hypothetical protein
MTEYRASFFVEGVPISQGSKSARVVKGKAILTDGFGKAPARLKAWRKNVWATASEWRIDNADVPGVCADQPYSREELRTLVYDVHLQFFLPKPKSVKRLLPTVKPDIDKLCRSVLDALTGTLYHDDSQVCRLTASKDYATGSQKPGVQIDIIAREV